jgi:hypothetical protein
MSLVSVTTALEPFTNFDAIPENVLEAAKERGTGVHGLIERTLKGLVVGSIPSEWAGYYRSAMGWIETWVEEVIDVEEEYNGFWSNVTSEGRVSFSIPFVGHPDLVCKLKGDDGITVIDWKTPLAYSKTWAPQMAAYRVLTDASRAFPVRLDRDGGPAKSDEKRMNFEADWQFFQSALYCHNYLNGRKK